MAVEISFDENLRDLRSEAQLSQEGLAKILGVKRSKIADWEKCRSMPNIEDIIDLADTFHTSCDMVLRGLRPEFLDIHKKMGLSKDAIETLVSYKRIADGGMKLNIPDETRRKDFRLFIDIINKLLTHKQLMVYALSLVRYMNSRELFQFNENADPVVNELVQEELKIRNEKEELILALKLKDISADIVMELEDEQKVLEGKEKKGGGNNDKSKKR